MMEMGSDLARRTRLNNASMEARSEKGYMPRQSIVDKAERLRHQSERPKAKRRVPWFTIISVASCIPMFMMDGGVSGMFASTSVDVNKVLSQKIGEISNNDKVKVSVTVGE